MAEETTSLERPQRKEAAPTPSRPEGPWQPIAALREEVDRLFDNFWRGFGGGRSPARRPGDAEPQPLWRFESALGMTMPDIDIVEAEQEYRIVAELPGMDAKDVELSVSGDVLTIRGEKKEEKEETAANYHLSERRFGSFQRSFQVPQGADRGAIAAAYDKGVLTVTLPKTPEAAQQRRRIEVKPAAAPPAAQ